jgi:heavy metal sensor kinase
MRLSIRWRLTLWYTLALAMVLLGFSGLVYGLLAHALYERIDDALLAQFRLLQQEEGDPRAAEDPAKRLRYLIHELQEHAGILCVVYDAQGRVTQHTEEMAAQSVPPAPAAPPGGPQWVDTTNATLGRQRALIGRLHLGGADYTVLLLDGLGDVDRELGELLTVLAMAVPAALVVAGALGYLLARQTLAPLTRLDRLTNEITAERLDRRLPVANPQDELGRLTQTINAMIARLEHSFAEVRRFTADAAHELRTPLTAIRTEAEVSLGKPLTAAEHQQLLGSILEECERLTRLTDQLLTLARGDAGGLRQNRESLDLAALVSTVAETMRPLAEARGLRLCVERDGALPVQGDEAHLREVFYNLVDNAVKYTPAGGSIEVRLRRHDQDAVVTLRDTGVGIPAEHLTHVFERFYRVDRARSRAEGGTGLGLSIAQNIIRAHGGRIELASTPGQGTTCTVTLPTGSGYTGSAGSRR